MKAVKVSDIGTDHDGFHPTKVTAGSPDVFIDGLPAARVGDPLEPHDKPNHSKHDRAIATGSSTVFINGRPAALTGGKIDCGGVTIGNGTVNIGDQPSSIRRVPVEPVKYDRIIEFDKEISAKVQDMSGKVLAEGNGLTLQTTQVDDSKEILIIWDEA